MTVAFEVDSLAIMKEGEFKGKYMGMPISNR